jgi:hypothetical protein
MAPTMLAQSLILDFRSKVLPRYVYAHDDCFDEQTLTDESVRRRIVEMVEALTRT